MFNTYRVEQLVSELGDEKKQQRAAYILVQLGKFILSDLIRGMEYQNEEGLLSVAAIIVHIGSPAVETLIQALETKIDPKCKKVIINILGEIGDERAVTPLKAILETNDPDLVEEAMEALFAISRRQLVPMMRSFMPLQFSPV